MVTLREKTMINLMDQLSDKPNWDQKNIVDWCLAELRYRAKAFRRTGAISVFTADVVKSDNVIPLSLKQELQAAVKVLEVGPASEQDWHPGSDEKVLDLVHPSLFPLVYGKLTTLDDCIELCGEGCVTSAPPDPEPTDEEIRKARWAKPQGPKPYSRIFQWLPCDVDIREESCKITSYINNLHPKRHANLYGIIEKIIDLAIPLWNMTLSLLKNNNASQYTRIFYDTVVYDLDPSSIPDTEGPQQEEGEDDEVYEDRREEWIEATRQLILPDVGEFRWEFDLRKDYGYRGLQVIAKLANIHLTPEKPEYEGGTWHIEGQLNEHICATAIYYYDSTNLTSSRLGFRQQVDTEQVSSNVRYEQDDRAWLGAVYGCEDQTNAIQDLGSIEAKDGRLVTFPNILQHRVLPFKLADPTKRDWWQDALSAVPGKGLSALPQELRDHVVTQVKDFPLDLEEAKELRLELMKERSGYVDLQTQKFGSHQSTLCEH
ncbi:hypothetical protein M422DRAFT_59122 [Sphaerobolus stellatus SS14]|nr:hypothetical protein M422DRAFT_59122 [Sphaerobolus stellatus SS14]